VDAGKVPLDELVEPVAVLALRPQYAEQKKRLLVDGGCASLACASLRLTAL
jgi:hypothetical protein